jgi:hypothetical protein
MSCDSKISYKTLESVQVFSIPPPPPKKSTATPPSQQHKPQSFKVSSMIHEQISFPDFVSHLYNFHDYDIDDEDVQHLQARFLHLALCGQLKSINQPENSTQYSIHFEENHITPELSYEIESI